MLRKRIASASETWSALSGGDSHKLKLAGEQFAAVTDLMAKLHPESKELAWALARTADATIKKATAPDPAVAMEVATTILYLDAVYEDLDPTDSELAHRSARLAQRLDHVTAGGQPDPMESWMEELYRRVSDRQTMGSVVAELRGALGEVEKSLDAFFRNTADKAPLREVPNHLAAMRGVFSVLGLDQPSLAALRMRAKVEQLLIDDVAAGASNPLFEQLGNNLGAMGFLIDMLSYQRELAKKLFVFDENSGELTPLMGREQAQLPSQTPEVNLQTETVLPVVVAPATSPLVVSAPAAVALASDDEDDDGELLDIFLEEAREVAQNGLAAIDALTQAPSELSEQTVLRRAFHTLKGSSRMVGLTEFGEAAWSFEQIMNSLLAEQRAASAGLLQLCRSAMQAFDRWIEDIAQGQAERWSASDFRTSADAMRLDGSYIALPWDLAIEPETPASESALVSTVPEDAAAGIATPDFDISALAGVADTSGIVEELTAVVAVDTAVATVDIDWDSAEIVEAVDLDTSAHGIAIESPEERTSVVVTPDFESTALVAAAEFKTESVELRNDFCGDPNLVFCGRVVIRCADSTRLECC